jgi:fermentation-respiration switch protein FrsA (DUF1100 family)
MTRWIRIALVAAGLIVATGAGGVAVKTRSEAHRLLTNPMDSRRLPDRRPIDFGMVFDEVTVTTSDNLQLAGWYVPGTNGALVMAQHGYKSSRGEMLNEAAMLRRHGYHVLITSIRAHDLSDGDLISFGVHEMKDLDAWYRFAIEREGVDPGRIGIVGNSMGGSIAIQYAAGHAGIKAVVTNSAFSSLNDTIETSLRFFTGLPPSIFAPLIVFWAEREGGFRAADVDAKKWIGRISPRAVLLMQGGADFVISTESGQRLFDAAGDPKELWSAPEVGHAGFDRAQPEEYERRVVGWFDRYLR